MVVAVLADSEAIRQRVEWRIRSMLAEQGTQKLDCKKSHAREGRTVHQLRSQLRVLHLRTKAKDWRWRKGQLVWYRINFGSAVEDLLALHNMYHRIAECIARLHRVLAVEGRKSGMT